MHKQNFKFMPIKIKIIEIHKRQTHRDREHISAREEKEMGNDYVEGTRCSGETKKIQNSRDAL